MKNNDKRKKWYQKLWIILIFMILGIPLFVFALILLIQLPFTIGEKFEVFLIDFSPGEVLLFFGAVLTFIGTFTLGMVTFVQNNKIHSANKSLQEKVFIQEYATKLYTYSGEKSVDLYNREKWPNVVSGTSTLFPINRAEGIYHVEFVLRIGIFKYEPPINITINELEFQIGTELMKFYRGDIELIDITTQVIENSVDIEFQVHGNQKFKEWFDNYPTLLRANGFLDLKSSNNKIISKYHISLYGWINSEEEKYNYVQLVHIESKMI